MRDLKADLEICNKATPGPWEWQENKWWGGHSGMTGKGDVSVLYPNHANDGDDGAAWFDDWENDNDRIFIAQAREGWPHAIGRAINAEAELAQLRKVVDAAKGVCALCPVRDTCVPDDCWVWPIKVALKEGQE